MTNPNENDKNKDAASDAKASGGEHKADKNAGAKETLNKIINKTGVLAGKAFALAKAATKDVVQELRNVNNIRKETVATAAEGTKKTDLAKTFWAKTSGKQRGIVLGLAALFLYVSYSVLLKEEHSKSSLVQTNTASTPTMNSKPNTTEVLDFDEVQKLCFKASGISKGFGESVAEKLRVPISSVNFLRMGNKMGMCSVTLDTPKGPQTCNVMSLATNGKEYWVTGGCLF